jgi:pilus assembly protein Flp/PilA
MSMKKGFPPSPLACATKDKHQRKEVGKARAETKHQRSK